jgi:hydrogenase maturation protease
LSIGLIGVGNILLQDEGLGVHVIAAIKEKYTCPSGLEIIDGGTLGLDLLPVFERFDKVILVDAVNFGKEPGYIGMLENDEIPAVIVPRASAHHIGLADLLSSAMLKGVMPAHVILIGMQPSVLKCDLGLEMSDIVNANMDRLVNFTLAKLKEWDVECIEKSG